MHVLMYVFVCLGTCVCVCTYVCVQTCMICLCVCGLCTCCNVFISISWFYVRLETTGSILSILCVDLLRCGNTVLVCVLSSCKTRSVCHCGNGRRGSKEESKDVQIITEESSIACDRWMITYLACLVQFHHFSIRMHDTRTVHVHPGKLCMLVSEYTFSILYCHDLQTLCVFVGFMYI
jgi:hypothetical protein